MTFPFPELPKPSVDQPPFAWFQDSASSSQRLADHFLKLKKPTDVTSETLELLNISFDQECDFEKLVPYASKSGQPYLPPKSWLEGPNDTEPGANPAQPILLSNGRKAPDSKDFYIRAKEILHKNEDAFIALSRKPSPGQVPPRLAHFRKFWEGLDNLAYYWDNSLDDYQPPKEEDSSSSTGGQNETSQHPDPPILAMEGPETQAAPCKKQKTDTVGNGSAGSFGSLGFGADIIPPPPMSIASSEALSARTAPPKLPWAMNTQAEAEKPVDLSKGSYSGYRIGNGAEMPDQYRLECVRGFLEPIAWAFAITFVPHRRPPVLCLENVRFPIRMNSVGWRSPSDRLAARRGGLEGPVIGIQCRPEVFGLTGNIQAESILDTVRELGGMLLLAQERAREGRTEKRGGEGKWWTTTPRWGGGPGGEVGEAAGASDAPSQETKQKETDKVPERLKAPGSKRRPSPAEAWKVLRPGGPLWDPRIIYEAIGKEKDSEWDEVSGCFSCGNMY